MTVRVAVVGLGYWGRNYPRVLRDTPGAELSALVDGGPALDRARAHWPEAATFKELDEMLDAGVADAAIISTPAATHFDVARRCIEAGVHVLVEKPLATTSEDARKLDEMAKAAGVVLLVGHTFLYSPRVEFVQKVIASGELGDVRYLTSRRLNLGKVRNDVDALWNFGPHDVSIAMHVLGKRPAIVGARELRALDRPLADVSFVNIVFDGQTAAHLHMSWLDPRRVRELTVIGSNAMLYYDDTETSEPIRIYEAGVEPDAPGLTFDNWADFQMNVRSGDVRIPKIATEEPLQRLCSHFVRCIAEGETPHTPGSQGVEVVRVLEAASKSASQRGIEVKLVPA
jgi:predicted dehydrogenase